jgi:hypothetical protein
MWPDSIVILPSTLNNDPSLSKRVEDFSIEKFISLSRVEALNEAGMKNALRAKPEDVREQHEREIKVLQEAYGEAMLEQRARKNCSLCWGKKGYDRRPPTGTERRWLHSLELKALPVV